jgi:hypothetical protein
VQAEPLYVRFTDQELHTIVDFLLTVNEFYGAQITRWRPSVAAANDLKSTRGTCPSG